jgi:hypothetical protein
MELKRYRPKGGMAGVEENAYGCLVDYDEAMEALAEERERCAKVCEKAHDDAMREAGLAKIDDRGQDAAEWLQRMIAYQNAANLIRKGHGNL